MPHAHTNYNTQSIHTHTRDMQRNATKTARTCISPWHARDKPLTAPAATSSRLVRPPTPPFDWTVTVTSPPLSRIFLSSTAKRRRRSAPPAVLLSLLAVYPSPTCG